MVGSVSVDGEEKKATFCEQMECERDGPRRDDGYMRGQSDRRWVGVCVGEKDAGREGEDSRQEIGRATAHSTSLEKTVY